MIGLSSILMAMSCFRAALQPPARVKRRRGDFELSAQDRGAKRLSLMPMPQKGLAEGESRKSWYPALAAWQSASKVLPLPVGKVDVRSVSNIAVVGGWQAGLCLDWYPLKRCWVAETSAQMSPRCWTSGRVQAVIAQKQESRECFSARRFLATSAHEIVSAGPDA